MFLHSMSFLLMFFLLPVTMFGAEDASALEASCKRTEAARHQDIFKASFVSLLTGNPVDLEYGLAYGKVLWRTGVEKVSKLFGEDKAKAAGPIRLKDPVVQKPSFADILKEQIKTVYSDDKLNEKNDFIDAQCQAHAVALEKLQAIEAASVMVSEDKKVNSEYILIQQHYNHLFEQYRFDLYALFPSYQKILNSFSQSKVDYDKALTDFFVELSLKESALNALHQKVLAAKAKYFEIIAGATIDAKILQKRANECKEGLKALRSKNYDSQVQDALKLAILKCDDPLLTQEDLVKFAIVIDQQALIPLKPSAHFDLHDAKNLSKLFLVIAVVGAVFYNKYKKDQKVYFDKLHAKIIYAEMPKEKREALLKRLECFKVKYIPHWIRKITKYDALDRKIDALYQATREKKLQALQLSKKASA
jgi:hypothetical protein